MGNMMSQTGQMTRRDLCRWGGAVAGAAGFGALLGGASIARADEAPADAPEGTQEAPAVDYSGTKTAYSIFNYVQKMTVEVDADGIVTDVDLDEACLPFAWARMAVEDGEQDNPPDDLLLADVAAWGGITGFSKYISIDGVVFEASLRDDDDPVLAADFKEVVKYTAVDGSIDDLLLWLQDDEANLKWYFDACVDRSLFSCYADGTPSDRTPTPAYTVMPGLEHEGEIAFRKAEIDQSLERDLFDWERNVAAFKEMVVGTTLSLTPDQFALVEQDDGKLYWVYVDTVSGATWVSNRVCYTVAKEAYQKVVASKLPAADQPLFGLMAQ